MKKNAFTIIEILMVVMIFAVLVTLMVPTFQRAFEKARTAEGIKILNALRKAQILYYTDKDDYAKESAWNDPVGLDVTITDVKYYQWAPTHPDQHMAAPGSIARVRRNSANNPGYGDYNLGIKPNGDIRCWDGSAEGACSRLGFVEESP